MGASSLRGMSVERRATSWRWTSASRALNAGSISAARAKA